MARLSVWWRRRPTGSGDDLAPGGWDHLARQPLAAGAGWGCSSPAVAEQERQQANALPEQWAPPSRAEVTDQRMGVALDGAMMNIKTEGWKEVKSVRCSRWSWKPSRIKLAVQWWNWPTPGTAAMLPIWVARRCWASRCGPKRGGGVGNRRRTPWVLGDGAPWIWNQAAWHFGASHQLVDWYHAKQHLVAAGQALKSANELARQRWLEQPRNVALPGTCRPPG